MKPLGTYHQGDINFIPLAKYGKTAKSVSRKRPLRSTKHRILLQEGEVTGHHHSIWFVPQPVHFRDDGMIRSPGATPANQFAGLFADPTLASKLGLDKTVPVVGFLVADKPVTIQHTSNDGTSTGEHANLELPAGGYLVTGKREVVREKGKQVVRQVMD